ncbi:hypothetical protein [Solihabitans fulvus]|uniref:hypothetical protein n=1 Tax=Solihabitans fulvus TaxID=1892852 RepID=UPI00166195F6|nr:hypothetical protein [Solihabitans fulvus]
MAAEPITVNYVPEGDDWAVRASTGGRSLDAHAPGLIAARDRADQLVEQLTKDTKQDVTVVHLLEGDALAFTTAYLHARHGLSATGPGQPPVEPAAQPPAETRDAPTAAPPEAATEPTNPPPAAEPVTVTKTVSPTQIADPTGTADPTGPEGEDATADKPDG